MTNCMHFMHPPKIIQIWWGRHDNFCVWKKSAITFGEGCTLMLDIHVYSAFMAWNLGYIAKKVHDIPPTLTKINLFGLTWFLCIRYIHTNVCWSFFHFGNYIHFFCWKKNYQTWNLTHPSPCYELWIISICDCDWLIDEILMIFFICRVPSCFKLWAYWFIHCIDDRPTIVYCLDCVKLLQYPCIFHSIL